MRIRAGLFPTVIIAFGAIGCGGAGPAVDDTATIGGHTYRFPNSAFQGGVVERGRISSLLLQVRWPTMEGLTIGDMFRTDNPEELLILGLSGAKGEPLADAVLAADQRQNIKIAVSEYGKPGFPLHPATPGSEHGPVPGGGMIMVEAHPDHGQAEDVFVSPSLEAPVELLSCGKADEVFTSPRCDQQLISRGMLLKVSYRRSMVGQWREIGAAVQEFLAAHEVVP